MAALRSRGTPAWDELEGVSPTLMRLRNASGASNSWRLMLRVSRAGKVYDVTGFLADHPGGDDLILRYAGRDVGSIMKDKEEHLHSQSAYDMLDEFVIGKLGTDETTVRDGERRRERNACEHVVLIWVL